VFWVGWDCRKGTFQIKFSPAQQISVQNILSAVPFLWEATELKTGSGQNSSMRMSESGTYKRVQHCQLWSDGLLAVTQGISSCTAHELRLTTPNHSAFAPVALPRLCHSCLLKQRRSLKIKACPSLHFGLKHTYMVDQMFYCPGVATEESGLVSNSNTEEQSNRISSASWKL